MLNLSSNKYSLLLIILIN